MIDSPVKVELTFSRIDNTPQLFSENFKQTITAEMWSDGGGNVQGEANFIDAFGNLIACVSRTAGFSEYHSELPGYEISAINGHAI